MIIALVLGTGWMFLCWALQGYSVVGMDGMRLGAVAPQGSAVGHCRGREHGQGFEMWQSHFDCGQ